MNHADAVNAETNGDTNADAPDAADADATVANVCFFCAAEPTGKCPESFSTTIRFSGNLFRENVGRSARYNRYRNPGVFKIRPIFFQSVQIDFDDGKTKSKILKNIPRRHSSVGRAS